MSANILWKNSIAEVLEIGQGPSAMAAAVITETYRGAFPLVEVSPADPQANERGEIELSSARIFRLSVGSDHYAVVVVCRMQEGAPQWGVYCGDEQVRGTFRTDGKALAAALRKEGKVSGKLCSSLEAGEWVGKVPELAGCGFFRMQARSGRYCSHSRAVVAQLQEETLVEMATELEQWLAGAEVSTAEVSAMMSEEEAAFYDAAFVQHVMLAGERGSGKTYLARMAAQKYDAVLLEMQMHPSMEPWEFRAHDRAWNGKVYTVLGKLAEAVHWIQQGKRVILVMDEFLNMNPMYTTVINSPLSLTSRDTYVIDTGRIIDQGDGIGVSETVEVPADMLWVVATTNIGARYNLDKIPPSVRARFQVILMNTNAERTEGILEQTLGKYDMPMELAAMFRAFIERTNQAVLEGTLDEEATTRLACNVIRSAYKKAMRDKKTYRGLAAWLPVIKKQLMAEATQVVNFETGPLDPEQAEVYKVLVEASFRAR